MSNLQGAVLVGIVLALLVGAPGAQLVAQDRLVQPIVAAIPDSSEFRVSADLLYRERDGRRLLMDVFTPSEMPAEGVPGVLFVHGGPLPRSVAAQGKDLGQYQSFGSFVTAANLAAIVFSHGFTGAEALQDARSDVEAAVDYVRTHANEWGVDPDRLCLVHVSAGGLFLAPILAQRAPWLKCVVLYYPLLKAGLLEELGAGSVAAEQRTGLDPFPFVTRPGETAPALLIAEAGGDPPVVNGELRRLREVASGAGWRVEYCVHPRGPHGFDVFDSSDRSRAILLRTRAFLQEQLYTIRADTMSNERMHLTAACGARR